MDEMGDPQKASALLGFAVSDPDLTPLYLHYISPVYPPYVSPISPLYLPN